MNSDQQALSLALRVMTGHSSLDVGTREEIHFVLAVCRHETSYGRGWKPPGENSHNWGAVQTPHPELVRHFSYGDSHANGQKYFGAFRIYSDEAEGLHDAAAILLKPDTRAHVRRGDGFCAVSRMREHRYFEAPLDAYRAALERNYQAFLAATGEPALLSFVLPPLAQPDEVA